MDGAAIVWYYIVGMFAAMTVALVADVVTEQRDTVYDASGAHTDAAAGGYGCAMQVTPWTPMPGGA